MEWMFLDSTVIRAHSDTVDQKIEKTSLQQACRYCPKWLF
jgi:hypothetical protein